MLDNLFKESMKLQERGTKIQLAGLFVMSLSVIGDVLQLFSMISQTPEPSAIIRIAFFVGAVSFVTGTLMGLQGLERYGQWIRKKNGDSRTKT
jgi:hypothetical protein